jgi:hypothetical protein
MSVVTINVVFKDFAIERDPITLALDRAFTGASLIDYLQKTQGLVNFELFLDQDKNRLLELN